jgi:hypothetical protein
MTVVDIQEGQRNGESAPLRRFVYASAGFRYEYPMGTATEYGDQQIKKYYLLYGAVMEKPGRKHPQMVRIEDSCSGEVTDFSACYQQAVRLVDNDMCKKYCDDVNSSNKVDCATICSDGVLLNPPNQVDAAFHPVIGTHGGGPWYAANYVKHGADASHPGVWYTFPVLESLFNSLGSKAMGFQLDSDSDQIRNTSVRRIETSGVTGSVETQENVAWSDTSRRSFVYNNNLDSVNGREITYPTAMDYTENMATDVYVSEVGGNYTETWTTGK